MGEGMGLKVAPERSSEVFPSNTLQLLGIPSEPGTAESFGDRRAERPSLPAYLENVKGPPAQILGCHISCPRGNSAPH